MSSIDENGFIRTRFAEQREIVSNKWLGYFPNTRTDEQSKNGRIISIQAELNDSADAKFQYILASFDPRSAVGNQLSNLAPLMNKRRRIAVRSSVTLTLTAGPSGATVPKDSIVGQSSGPARFVTTSSVTIAPNGTREVLAYANTYGPVVAAAGSINTIITPVFGWTGVTNANAASVGRDRDTDGVLRANMLSTSAGAVGTPEGIRTALIEIPGVTYAKIYENRYDVANTIGMPPHSVFVVVEGGADKEIGDALMATVAYGINYTSSANIPSADWVEQEVQNPANLQQDTVWFSRPVPRPINVVVNIETDATFPDDGAARIKPAIVELVTGWEIGRVLYASRLYNPVNTVPGVDINSISINGVDRVTPAAFEKITIAESNITINVS